jgi:S-adenosylmethionine:tRNA ribosyltransferase-isomerase
MILRSDFNFDLPEDLIAQTPLKNRERSRLLVLNKSTGEITHKMFTDIMDYMSSGDCLVINNTKVYPARLYGVTEDSFSIELLLLSQQNTHIWEAIVKPGKKIKKGIHLDFSPSLSCDVLDVLPNGNRLLEFHYSGDFYNILDKVGHIPLPPYIKRSLYDNNRYQTVYAKNSGSIAAPTAGLHFNEYLLSKVNKKGVDIAEITLHVGLGTFRPVKAENILDHNMHAEYFCISKNAATTINNAKSNGHKIIAVGTTTCRTLESVANDNGYISPCSGYTDIFIYPGYTFKTIDRLITNFHLPESTLIMLVSAMCTKENTLAAYDEAISHKYRFFSFGDAMICI